MYKFNFDEWAELAQSDPEEFERKRKEVLEAEIMKASVANRYDLRLIQMQCDALRETYGPVEAAAAMLGMAQQSLKQLKTPLTQLRQLCEDIVSPPTDEI
jgi:hypothetical protein